VGPVTSLWSDLGRPPLSERALRAALVRPGGFVREVHVVAETGSTNADLAEVARRGGPEGVVLVAEALYSYEGTREINTLIVGRAVTGHSAFV